MMLVDSETGLVLRRRLGEILVNEGLLTDEKLRTVLSDQAKSKMKLGQFLHRNGILPESRIIDALSKQLRVEKFDAAKYPIDPALAQLIPPDIAEKYQAVPIAKNGTVLKVGLLDPMDLNALDAVEVLTNIEVEPVICSEKDFNSLLGALYGKYSKLGGVMEDVSEMEYDQESSAGKSHVGRRGSGLDL